MTTTITAPTSEPSALCSWLAELAREAGSSLFILCGAGGKLDVRLERGTHGRYDAIVECDLPFTDELEREAYKAMQALEGAGTHTVRRTDNGVRAFLRAGWTRCYEGRANGAAPAEFNSADHRPWCKQPIPDSPKPNLAGIWDDDELAAICC